jgi:hypothetical protein
MEIGRDAGLFLERVQLLLLLDAIGALFGTRRACLRHGPCSLMVAVRSQWASGVPAGVPTRVPDPVA